MFPLFKARRAAPPQREPYTLEVAGLSALVRRKAMRTLRLRLHPPEGRLEVSAPLRLSEGAIREFIASRLDWIKSQRQAMAAEAQRPQLNYTDGETVSFLGRALRLRVLPGRLARARLGEDSTLLLSAPEDAPRSRRAAAVQRCLGRALLEAAAELLPGRETAMGVKVERLKVRAMRSRWGSCGISSRTITLALELAQRPAESLEYVLVHELAHLRVRSHGKRFKSIMDGQLSDWRRRRKDLNSKPIPA